MALRALTSPLRSCGSAGWLRFDPDSDPDPDDADPDSDADDHDHSDFQSDTFL